MYFRYEDVLAWVVLSKDARAIVRLSRQTRLPFHKNHPFHSTYPLETPSLPHVIDETEEEGGSGRG
ncbi:MAG: hypothetical protein OJF49_004508 [Ktedonobacterales bacterium]|nr:MAG: hypothetical protein OJF49_004508 [Ktedonobacterales bacterium]